MDSAQIDDVYNVAKQYYNICKNYTDKIALFQDLTIANELAEFLKNPQVKVVYMASKILLLLTETEELCSAVIDVPGLVAEISEAKRRILPPKILRNLLLTHSRVVAAEKVLTTTTLVQSESCSQRANFIQTRGSRNVVFKFEKLNSTDKRAIEAALVRAKGVVSLYFDTPNRRIVVRAMNDFSSQYLSSCILKNTHFESIKHVFKNEFGTIEEHEHYADLIDLEIPAELPPYLDVENFDSLQSVATKEQLYSFAASSWFTSIRAMFW